MNWLLAITPLLGLVIQIIVSFILTKRFSNNALWKDLFLGFCTGLLFTLFFSITVAKSNALSLVDIFGITCVNSLAVVALCFCYFNFVNLNYTSLRIRLLREFVKQGGKLSLTEILKKYDAEVILTARLSRLIKAKELSYDGEYFIPGDKSRFAFIGTILKYFKILLLTHSTINKESKNHGGDYLL